LDYFLAASFLSSFLAGSLLAGVAGTTAAGVAAGAVAAALFDYDGQWRTVLPMRPTNEDND
jgi:hypothetical protein